MAELKDGAFAIALKKRIPILPVSLLDDYRIMQGSFFLSWHKCRVICHEPISPEGYSMENLEEFKKIMAHSYNVMPTITSLAFAIVC